MPRLCRRYDHDGHTYASAGAPAGGRPSTGAATARNGEYSCAAAYPSAARSLQLGRQNLHLFRLKNTRFDVVGGILYFIFVVCQACALSVLQSATV